MICKQQVGIQRRTFGGYILAQRLRSGLGGKRPTRGTWQWMVDRCYVSGREMSSENEENLNVG